MSSNKEYKDYVLEKLQNLKTIKFKPMMGEYLLYVKNILIGGIYDNRLLLKKTKLNSSFALNEAIPYKNAKPMFLVETLDDPSYICNLIQKTYEGLKQK